MRSVKRLLTPLSYLRIDRQDKFFDEIALPLLLLIISLSVFWLLDWKLVIFGSSGLVAGVGSYLQVVTGFYIASLAAIATFNQKNMDLRMAGESPTLTVEWMGIKREEKLSRRRFLCFLFGYLSFLSIFLYFGGVGANLLAQPILSSIPATAIFWVKWSFVSVYLFIIYNLICTTLLGLYYMTERIHRPEAESAQPQISTDPQNCIDDVVEGSKESSEGW
ncbi:hypothetical protein CCX46_09070 [Pseudomonas sp. RU47]|uniref:hypothetical protein n=1 Tax=Pseudomonas sp. RU47 TaxID=2005388 RepID=UPI000FDDA2CD|nr:hypothetical protein [Pseudomonas sp. RU47]AZZ75294.1 hypothetical protein CCX46_09070 [Pseudomonas sp. RU47]